MSKSIDTVLDEVFSLYEQHGTDDYIGEDVSQIEHMCQAAELAEADGQDDEVILGAFFHDIGHICEPIGPENDMDGYGNADHESAGARFLLERGFSPKIARLVETHVEAKRYLCKRNPDYFARLSPASRKTLEFQGGPMSEEEAVAFEADPWFREIIKVRAWDELAKEPNRPLPPLKKYREMARRHLLSRISQS